MSVPPVSPSDIGVSVPSPEGKVQALLDGHFASIPSGTEVGCNLVIMQKGKEPVRLCGGNLPLDAPQHWGSNSKQFTAASIAKLVTMGLINRTDNIRDLCPDLPRFMFEGEERVLTVDDLLHMRSGLPEVWALALVAAQDAESLNNDEILALLYKHPGLIYLPGAEEMYCNTNYYVLAKIVEDVARKNQVLSDGQSFVDFVRDQVLVPHGMQARCSIDPTCPQSVRGYDTQYRECTTGNRSYGTTGIIGPPSDMISWNMALESGELDALLELPQGVTIDPSEPIYCRGLIRDEVGGYRRIRHGGALNGFVTVFHRYEHNEPEKNFACFLATNLIDIPKAERIVDDVVDILAGKPLERMSPREEVTTPLSQDRKEEALKFAGAFHCEEFNTEWEVEVREDSQHIWGVHLKPADHRPGKATVFL